MSFRAGRTSSSQNFEYSRVSPDDFENSTMATSGAISNTSAVTDSFPFLPSDGPCSRSLKSFASDTLKLSFFATVSIFSMIVDTEHLDVNMDPVFLLFSNKLDRSNPDDIDDINSNALKNFGVDSFGLSKSESSVFAAIVSFIVNERDLEKSLRNQGTRVIAPIVIRLPGSTTRIFEIKRFDSAENHGGHSNSALKTFLYIVMMFSS
uniref:Uncharacterized protein n=1 Tax=Cucumis sativus TaxID=3659 RepID=A0A0A0L4B0_CUCSA